MILLILDTTKLILMVREFLRILKQNGSMGVFKSLTYNSVETLHAASLVTGNIHANGRKHITRIQCSNDHIALISKLQLIEAPFSGLGTSLEFL